MNQKKTQKKTLSRRRCSIFSLGYVSAIRLYEVIRLCNEGRKRRVPQLGCQEGRRETERESMYVLYVLCVCVWVSVGEMENEKTTGKPLWLRRVEEELLSQCVCERKGRRKGIVRKFFLVWCWFWNWCCSVFWREGLFLLNYMRNLCLAFLNPNYLASYLK